jgi:hypothetical protein
MPVKVRLVADGRVMITNIPNWERTIHHNVEDIPVSGETAGWNLLWCRNSTKQARNRLVQNSVSILTGSSEFWNCSMQSSPYDIS